MSNVLQTRTAVRRWSALQCRNEIADLSAHLMAETFSFRTVAEHCLRLVGASAAALAEEAGDGVINAAYFETEEFQLQLYEGERSDPADFAAGFARALLAYVLFAKRSLKLRMPAGFVDCVTQLLERFAVPYLAADPDVNWNILVRQCWSLYDAVAAHQQPFEIEGVMDQICLEIRRVEAPENASTVKIDYDEIAKRNAPTAGSSGSGGYTPVDESLRFHRLVQRHQAQIAAGVPDPDEHRRVSVELYHLTDDDYRVDPRRLYGDGPYPWEAAVAE